MVAERDLNASDNNIFITVGLCACELVFLSPLYPFVSLVTHSERNYTEVERGTVGIQIKRQRCYYGVKNYKNLHLVFPACLDLK